MNILSLASDRSELLSALKGEAIENATHTRTYAINVCMQYKWPTRRMSDASQAK